LEDFYLKSLLPNYNILTEAGSSFGYKHTEMTRIKMRSNYSLERRILIGNLNSSGRRLRRLEPAQSAGGKTLSEETRNLISSGRRLRRLEPAQSAGEKALGIIFF
jgi:hypothetical protein